MSERERLERYLDDFGVRLSGAADLAPHKRRPRRRVVLAAAAAVAAAGIVALLLGGASDERLDPVAEARAALAPAGDIVYMKITSTVVAGPGISSVPPPQTTEQWSTLNPSRWRFVQTVPVRSAHNGTMRDAQGRIIGREEFSYADGVQRSYVARHDTLSVITGVAADGPNARVPSILGSGSGDVDADLRSLLEGGPVSDEGEQQAGGRTVRRFVVARSDGTPVVTRRFVYDVDPQTFAPIGGTLSVTLPMRHDGVRGLKLTTRLHVDTYKRIPFDATSARLLLIRTTPRTTVTSHSERALRERAQRLLKSCKKRKNGTLVCPAPPRIRPNAP